MVTTIGSRSGTRAPLDGVWLRAPYLHNGSVPTLRALLFPDERPAVFYRGYDVYDWDRVGFMAQGADAEREGVRFDTSQRGNANTGFRATAHELSARRSHAACCAPAARRQTVVIG